MAKRPLPRINALGSYLPKKILTNQDLEKIVDTSDEWIVSRTGMRERRIAAEDEYPSDMGAEAAKKALEESGIMPEEVDLIITATMTPDYISPSTAALIQAKLNAVNAAAFDIQCACTGFLYGLSMAKAYIESNLYRCILVIATEKMSAFMDYQDRSTCVLFGDGATAALITGKGSGLRIDSICLGADGQLASLMQIPAGGSRKPASACTVNDREHYFKMAGNEVFKHAVRRMSLAAKECLEKAGLGESDISWLIPHQANIRIIDAVAKHFGVPDEKVYKTVHKYGNTSASTIGIALVDLIREKGLKKGEHVLLAAFGGGLTWGAAVLTKINGTRRK